MRRFRWAPTPSGPLHLGNLFSILLTWLEARESRGEILLRIDDLDATRARPEFIEEIFEVLEALRLGWQLGPKSMDEFQRRFSQGTHQSPYRVAWGRARAAAPDLFYACACSRKDLPPGKPYPGTCRFRSIEMTDDGRVSWRIRSDLVPGAPAELGDVILFRKERLFSYQWVSLHDDLHWAISDIHRGEDLLPSSRFQQALAAELARRGLVEYAPFGRIRFVHHPLVMDGEVKLSKSEGAQAVHQWLSHPRRIFGAFLEWIGWGSLPVPESSEQLLSCYLEQRAQGVAPSFASSSQLSQLMN